MRTLIWNRGAALALLAVATYAVPQSGLAADVTAPPVVADAVACNTGLAALQKNLYRYPERPEIASGGRESWKSVFERFKTSHLAACNKVDAYLTANKAEVVAAPATTIMKADNVPAFSTYLVGKMGVVFHGDRILGYCAAAHQAQYDCVSASQRISKAAASMAKILEQLAALECEPEKGWSGCRTVALKKDTTPLRIFSTPAVSLNAQKAVDTIYGAMLGSLQTAYDPAKFAGYRVYLSNGEAWTDLKGKPPMGFMGDDKRNDELRGGTTPDYLWIEEQMICKRGVATRNAAFKAGTRDAPDNDVRTFDQVVHEFAHAIDFKYGLQAKYKADAFPGAKDFEPAEDWAWGVQHFFGTPAGTLNDKKQKFLESVFDKKKVTPFDCAKLMPGS